MTERKAQRIAKDLNEKYTGMKIVVIDGQPTIGEASEIDGIPAIDNNASILDPHEELYVMGIHREIDQYITKRWGLFAEFQDPGTVKLYEM